MPEVVSLTEKDSGTIAQRLALVQENIHHAQGECPAPHRLVTLIAVSKRQPVALIRAALEAGHRDFGENIVQHAHIHWPTLKAEYPDVRLHMLGHLQRNKVKEAIGLFDVLHTLDSPKLADVLAKMRDEGQILPALLVQVNTGDEAQKSGVAVRDLSAFLIHCREQCGLAIAGLMCIPPVDAVPAFHFALLRKLADEYALPELSMGMSGDYPDAVRFGARYVRVGTAIFGERDEG